MKFVLVDPRRFAIPSTAQIRLRQEFFTDDMAKEYALRDESVLFISDIRTEPNDDKHVARDMANQMRWHMIMKPKASMFKFRLPWSAGTTSYLAGDVYMQPYAATRSTETRLIVTSCELKEWDNKTYERQCFFFNTEARLYKYSHGVSLCGFDDSWDCASEVHILSEYFAKHLSAAWRALSPRERATKISELSWQFTEHIKGEPYDLWRSCRAAQLKLTTSMRDIHIPGAGWVCFPCANTQFGWRTSVGYRAGEGPTKITDVVLAKESGLLFAADTNATPLASIASSSTLELATDALAVGDSAVGTIDAASNSGKCQLISVAADVIGAPVVQPDASASISHEGSRG